MMLSPTPVSARQFTWIKNKFVAEISDLGPSFRFGRVWDDSCDEGLTLYSQYAGHEPVVFVVSNTEVRDGELLAWHLEPADKRLCPFTITIFND
jgi:hypothetical protein